MQIIDLFKRVDSILQEHLVRLNMAPLLLLLCYWIGVGISHLVSLIIHNIVKKLLFHI